LVLYQASDVLLGRREGVCGGTRFEKWDQFRGFNALWIGDPNEIQGAVTPATLAWGAESGLEHVAENRPLIIGVRSALREEGWRISGNAIARKTKLLGKFAGIIHVGFALQLIAIIPEQVIGMSRNTDRHVPKSPWTGVKYIRSQ
jgi:hypothetical protein